MIMMIVGGMPTLTFVHVLISLIGILTGFIVVFGMFGGRALNGWTAIFLLFTVLTSVTGFVFFPYHGVTPAIVVGVISLVVLAITIVARYVTHMAGAWRGVYVVTAVLAFYLNFFVLIAQSFDKVPALHAAAPTQKEPPFLVAQAIALVVFVAFAVIGVKKFHPGAATAA